MAAVLAKASAVVRGPIMLRLPRTCRCKVFQGMANIQRCLAAAGSERIAKSEVAGQQLKEAQVRATPCYAALCVAATVAAACAEIRHQPTWC